LEIRISKWRKKLLVSLYALWLGNLTDFYRYKKDDTGDCFSLGHLPVYQSIPLVYFEGVPQSKLGTSFLVQFELVYKHFSREQTQELVLELSLYDEYISFSLDCSDVQSTDPKIQRQSDGTFQTLDTANFIAAGKYLIWWKAPYINYEGYIIASNHFWIVTDTPTLDLLTPTTHLLNSRYFKFQFKGTIAKDDEFQLFSSLIDWNPGNEIGNIFINFNSIPTESWSILTWIPETALEMHLCWRTQTNGIFSSYERVHFSNSTSYSLTLIDINSTSQALPSILEFSHTYGTVINPGEELWFAFANSTDGHPNIVPSHNPSNLSDFGKIEIVLGSVISSHDPLFSQTFTHTNEEQNQGNVMCNKPNEQAGKCFIEGFSLSYSTQIYICFYTNSFSYTDGTSRFYLFGSHNRTNSQYCHKLYYIVNLQIVEESDEYAWKKLFLKIDSSFNIHKHKVNLVHPLDHYYKPSQFELFSANIELYVDGQVCETPTASINFDTFNNLNLELFNLDLKNWTEGNLMANFVWTFIDINIFEASQIYKYDLGNFQILQNDVKVATIGWGDRWLHWKQDASNTCEIWQTGYMYIPFKGEWTASWPPYFFISKNVYTYLGSDYEQMTCVEKWPLYKYPGKDRIWASCHESWIKCTGSLQEDWTRCEFPYPFLLKKSCVNEWPDDLYVYNYTTYTWDATNYYDSFIVNSNPECQQTGSLYSTDNLSVKINLIGVGSTVMVEAEGTLHMEISNKRGNITVNQFIQKSPVPDQNDVLTNLFPLISTSPNRYLNETQTVDLNPDTINNYPDGTIFEVKAVVQNDWGDKAISYINFFKDPGPTIGDAVIICPSTPCKILEEISINLTGNWYNSVSLKMELFIKIEIKIAGQTEVLVVPELYEHTEFTFRLPAFQAENNTNLLVDILITAISNNANFKTLTKSIIVDNTLPNNFLISDYSTVTDFGDLEQLALFSAQLKFLLKSPVIWLYNGVIWRKDADCSNQGIWVQSGAYCEWNENFSGLDWSIKSHDFTYLPGVINPAILSLTTMFGRTKDRSNIEIKLNILSYLLIRPDLIKFQNVEVLPGICEQIGNLDDSPLLSFLPNFGYNFIQIASHYYSWIYYEVNVNMRYYNETAYKNNVFYKSYSKKLEMIKSDSKSVWVSLEKYLVKISSKVTLNNPIITHETNAGLFRIEYKIANTLNGTTYSINSVSNYQINFPGNLFSGTSITDLSVPLKVLTIDWYISPVSLSNLDLLSPVADTLSIHIIDKHRDIVKIESKVMTITLPFSHKSGYNMSNIGCSSWSLTVANSSMSEQNWTVIIAPLSPATFINCLNWTGEYLATISTSHLSSFAIVEATNKTVEEKKYHGVGDKKKEKFDEPPLVEQNGFYVLVALFGVYLSGMILIRLLPKKELI
jgi:hypothetical protein